MKDVSNSSDKSRQLIEQAVGLNRTERAEFLRARCGHDESLRLEVEAHFADEGGPGSGSLAKTMDPSTADAEPNATTRAAPHRPTPTTIGPYKLLEVIGEGGFGTVWVADQQSPVRRRVAVKIINPGMDSRTVIARFEQERQALAIMDHPNIAKVLDAGTAPDGRPFFVMEYVAGESITTYCDRNRLSVEQRLELFIPVCDAVQHAHHKGIIHRDIKPSNVLVTLATGTGPMVKVIDFGVAKAINHVLTDKTLFTEHGQILGTPEYMSPEQAEMGALDIDTRADVYSLGVLLYELLTGALPFEAKDLRSKGYNEIQRIIREVDPPRPSNRLRSLGAKSAEIAQRRQSRLEELEGQLRRELEWIPLKAMRKDRDHRYATPIALAEDIRNHLAGRPLVAGPESALYRARKFVLRNRTGVAAAALIAIAITAGAIVSTIGFVRAARNAELYHDQKTVAEANADRAEAESRRLRQVNKYNTSLLSSANPVRGERRDVTVRELLDGAVLQLDSGAQKGQPRIEAALRATLAGTYRSLNLWKPAEEQWLKALQLETDAVGSDSPEAAYAMAGLGQLQLDTNRLKEAEKSLKQALLIQREQLAPDDPQLADTINNLGLLAYANGDWQTAQSFYREALSIYQKHPDNTDRIADAMTNLSTILNRIGENRPAIEMASEALVLRRQRFGEKHIDVWNSLVNLASMKEAEDDLNTAEKMRREALALSRSLVDEKHRMTVISLTNLARTLWLKGGGGALDEAEKLQNQAIEIAHTVDGAKSLAVVSGLDRLGSIARDRGQLDRAIELYREALAMRSELLSPDHPDVATEMALLADALARSGKSTEAIDLATRSLEIRSRAFPAGNWAIWSSTSILGGAYTAAGDFDKAEPLLLDSFKGLEKGSALGKRPAIEASARLVALYEKWGKPEQAVQWRHRSAELVHPAGKP